MVSLRRREGVVIGDEPDNTETNSGSAEQAVSEGEERAGIPFLPTLRQGV
jgi:hypothetical protein